MEIGLVAAEASGDALGAALIDAIRRRVPGASFGGAGGPLMRAAGCDCWLGIDELSVMGLTEVLAHLPRLWRLRRKLAGRFLSQPPDAFVGIDAPDFNLGLERSLRRSGIPTVQYVSPSVWAWRHGRIRFIDAACDRVLCLFPFEKQYYDAAGVEAVYVGHPVADQMPVLPDRAGARRRLGFEGPDSVVALLPGSRQSEVARLGGIFAEAAAMMRAERPALRFIAPMVNSRLADRFAAEIARHSELDVRILVGASRECLAASDLALVASGTATLEAALARTPMVVAYRIGRISRWVAVNIGGLDLKRYALPNLITGRELVREFMMEKATPSALSRALLDLLDDPAQRRQASEEFEKIHQVLRCDASDRAAAAVLDLIGSRRG